MIATEIRPTTTVSAARLLAPGGLGVMWRAARDQFDAFPALVGADPRTARAVYRSPQAFTGLLRAFLAEYGAATGATVDQRMIDHWTAYHACTADLVLAAKDAAREGGRR